MEGPQRTGAGPETTGIEGQQELPFFDQQQGDDGVEEGSARRGDAHHQMRSHAMGHRPDRLHTSEHFGVRGGRHEIDCTRRDRREK